MSQTPSGPQLPAPIWDDAARAAYARLLSAANGAYLAQLRQNLAIRKLAFRSIMFVTGLLLVIQGFLRPTGLWVLPKELLAYAVGIAGFWAVGALLGATITVREVVGYGLFGFFAAPILTVAIMRPLLGIFGSDIGTGVVVPVVEEVIKVVPVLLLALTMRRDPRGARMIHDFFLVGFASGAGFAIHEDVLWQRVLVAEGPLKFIAPWIYNEGNYFSGSHAVWTALIGAAIGVIVWFRGRKFTWVLAAVVALTAVAEHMAWNYWGSFDFLGLLGNGMIPLAIFYLTWFATIGHILLVRAWGKQRDALFSAPAVLADIRMRNFWHRLEYARLLTQAHGQWLRAHEYGSRRTPGAIAVERIVLAALDAEMLHVVSPIPRPPDAYGTPELA